MNNGPAPKEDSSVIKIVRRDKEVEEVCFSRFKNTKLFEKYIIK